MKYLNVKAFVGIAIVLTVGIWLCLLFLVGLQLEATWTAFKQLPTVLTIEMTLWGLFVKWGWRYKIFQNWLVPFPLIQGTWKGMLTSTWIDPVTQNSIDPIEMYLVIRQSFISIHCTVFTRESESRSHSATIHVDYDSGEKRLVYTYTNKPRTTVRDRSAIHDGTASLLIVNTPPSELRGEYWTSRKSTGEINLKYQSESLLDKFPE